MMVLYSGTTCPFSQRCRFVLFEKGMDFEIRDVDLYNKPEDISIMNPYGQVPILVERDLILYESNIINEYIDERFPHPHGCVGADVPRAAHIPDLVAEPRVLERYQVALLFAPTCGVSRCRLTFVFSGDSSHDGSVLWHYLPVQSALQVRSLREGDGFRDP